MAKNLILGGFVAVAWLVLDGLATAHSAESNFPDPATTDGRLDVSQGMRRAPVPLVRQAPPPYAPPAPASEPSPRPSSVDANRGMDARAAKAAAEADGYKRVTVVGRGPDGIWRAKGYRGATEVGLGIDGSGRVTTE